MLAYVCTYIHTCMYREKDKKVGKAMYQKQWHLYLYLGSEMVKNFFRYLFLCMV